MKVNVQKVRITEETIIENHAIQHVPVDEEIIRVTLKWLEEDTETEIDFSPSDFTTLLDAMKTFAAGSIKNDEIEKRGEESS